MLDTKEMRSNLTRTGRAELLERVRLLCDEVDRLRQELALITPTTRTPQRQLLPGWMCEGCGVFNGEVKRERLTCRACDKPKPVQEKL